MSTSLRWVTLIIGVGEYFTLADCYFLEWLQTGQKFVQKRRINRIKLKHKSIRCPIINNASILCITFYLPASAPFPALGRSLTLFGHITTTFCQICRAASLSNSMNHTSAGHRIHKRRLTTSCNVIQHKHINWQMFLLAAWHFLILENVTILLIILKGNSRLTVSK